MICTTIKCQNLNNYYGRCFLAEFLSSFIENLLFPTTIYLIFYLYCLLLSHYHSRLVKSYSTDLWHRYINLLRPYSALIDFANASLFHIFSLLGKAEGFGTMYYFINKSHDVHIQNSKKSKKMLSTLTSSADRLNHLICALESFRTSHNGINVPDQFTVHTHCRMFHNQFVSLSASEPWLSYKSVEKGLAVRLRHYLAYEMYHLDLKVIKSHDHYLKYISATDWIYTFDFSKR